ncbi:MAG: DegT/DnrJ/EryC1/StrS family aminotransferase, partial [Pseudomonadota bacterium]
QRRRIWAHYHDSFQRFGANGLIELPKIPKHVTHNGHMYQLILPDPETRSHLMQHLGNNGIRAVFHYTPLHESSGGKKFCRVGMPLEHASSIPHRLLRLPLYPDLEEFEQIRVIECVSEFLERL